MHKYELQLITNKELIAINQDPSGQGKIIKQQENSQVWAKQLSNGDVAVLLLNLDKNCRQPVSIGLKELGFGGEVSVRDAIEKKDMGVFQFEISADLRVHQSAVFVVSNKAQ